MILQKTINAVSKEQETQCNSNLSGDILVTRRRLVASSNTMWVYSCVWDSTVPMVEEVPVKVQVKGSQTLTDGRVVGCDPGMLWLGVKNNLGPAARPAYVKPDINKFFLRLIKRLKDIESEHLSLINRPFGQLFSDEKASLDGEKSLQVRTIDSFDLENRRARVTDFVLDRLRLGKRILLTSAHNRALDESLLCIVRAMRMEGLSYSTLVTRYPALVLEAKGTTDLRELAFEEQFRTTLGKVQAEQATLHSAYHRYQKLTPSVTLAQSKIEDLEEVEALEDRLLREVDKLERKDTDLKIHVDTYEKIPLWQRLSMQVGGKNPPTMRKMRLYYAEKLQALQQELTALQGRLTRARQEAYIDPKILTEYEDLREAFEARGGIENIRSLISQDNKKPDHVFQGRGLVAATAGCVTSQDLFSELSFDTVIVDGLDDVPLPLLIPVAALARKEIILFGNGNDLTTSADNVVDDRKYSKERVACLSMSVLEAFATQGSTL